MTTDVSYAARYYAKWAPYQSSLDQMIRDNLSEQNWALPCDTAGGLVSYNVGYALDCLYPNDPRRGEVFLLRAIDFADRLIIEKRYLDTDIAEVAHPRELADILRFRAYAQWLLGEPLDRKVLKQAAGYYAEWCTTKAVDCKRFAEPGITMDYYLGAVRCAMLACDLDCAGELLKIKQPFRWHFAIERKLWLDLMYHYPDLTDEFDCWFEDFFDRVRDPDFQDGEGVERKCIRREWLAFDTALIREMYIINASPHEPVDPMSVIKAVAR